MLKWIWLSLLAAVCGGAGAAEDPEKFRDEVTHLLWWADFDGLERLHTRLQQPGQRTTFGGSLLTEFRGGLSTAFNGKKDSPDAFFVELEALTLEWAREHPDVALAHALHARALLAHAWSYRGTGYTNTVPPRAWADFERYVGLAADYMAKNAKVAFSDSTGHAVMIVIGRAAGWDRDRLWALAQDGLAKNPDDDDLYFEMLTSLLPKWGGSAVAVDRFIQEAVTRTKKDRGLELYARLYSSAAAEEFEHQLFSKSGAEWPKMSAGYRDLLARYPAPTNVNRYAYFACLAGDKPTFLDLMEQVGAKPLLDRWGRNASRTFETCKRWASQQ